MENLRRVGDRSSLVIPLNIDFIQAPSIPDSPVDFAQFEISRGTSLHNHNRGPGNFWSPILPTPSECLEMEAQEVASVAVRHTYTTASKPWRDYLSQRLRRWAWIGLFKLKPKDRPIQHPDLEPMASDLQYFKVPQSWDYADDQI